MSKVVQIPTPIKEINAANRRLKLAYLQQIAGMFPYVKIEPKKQTKQNWTSIIRQTSLLAPGAASIYSVMQSVKSCYISKEAMRLYNDIANRGTGVVSWAAPMYSDTYDNGESVYVLPIDSEYNNGLPALGYSVSPGVMHFALAYDNEYAETIDWILLSNEQYCAIIQPVAATRACLYAFNMLYEASCHR